MGIQSIWSNDFYEKPPQPLWAFEVVWNQYSDLPEYAQTLLHKAATSGKIAERKASVIPTYFGGVTFMHLARSDNADQLTIEFNENENLDVTQALQALWNRNTMNQDWPEGGKPETTNPILNLDLFDLLDPKTLMCWMRTMVANRLTDNGLSWTQVFSKHNSGTYNNQFQILDLKLIDTTKKKISSGALYILEQYPGGCDVEEVTDYLKKGYWPSYNTPYIHSVREKTGIIDAIKKDPSLIISRDYDSCARAKIFRREQSKVKDIESYKKLIRFNDYLHDEFSEGSASNTIAARNDLNQKPACYGATDAKFASVNEIKTTGKKIVHIISGPTTDGHDPFVWSTATCKLTDQIRWNVKGHVDEYNFNWIDYEINLW